MTVRKSTNLEQDRADLIKFANLDIAENIDVTDCNLRALINLELAQRIANFKTICQTGCRLRGDSRTKLSAVQYG